MYRPPSIPPPVRPGGGETPGGQPRPPASMPGQSVPVRLFPGNAPQSVGQTNFMTPGAGGMRGGPPPPPFRPQGMPQPGAAPGGYPFSARAPFMPPPQQQIGPPPANGASLPPGPGTIRLTPGMTHPGAHGIQGPGPMAPFRPQAPGMPNVPPPGSAMPPPPPSGPFAPRASRPSSPKIDPSQIPRPSHKESDPCVTFQTRHNGQHHIPPMASSKYTCQDTGNCDPKFMRLSLNNIPSQSEQSSNLALPLVAFIQPLALQKPDEAPIPVVDFGEPGPVRCGRCRAYMNPFMYFQDGGRSFVCVFCNVKNETPSEYFCYLGHDGKRRDAQERAELSKGTVDIVAPPAFMVRPPMPPVHFFLIDASFSSASSGVLHAICQTLKVVMDSIQGQDRALVGIATFGPTIEFYHIKNADGSPQVLIVSDITEVFAPLPTLLMPLSDSKDSIIEILDLIPKLHENQTSGESCAGAAIEAAVEVLKPTGGKLHAILTTRPTKGSRALKPREASPSSQSPDKIEKEKQMILLPQDNTYRTLGMRAAEYYVSIDLFCLAQNYIDISTCSVLSHMTGGSVYHYDKFTVQHYGQQFLNDLRWNLSRPQGLEAVLRLRCSAGLEIENYLGSMNVRNQHEIELPAIDCDKSIMAKILHDDKLQEGTEAYLQCALLYTTTSGRKHLFTQLYRVLSVAIGERRIRVFRGADVECYINYIARRMSVTLPGNTLQQTREMITNGCSSPLAAYRKYCATPSSSCGQLILPDSMKLLPLYTLGLLKSIALRLDAKPDERSAFLSQLLSLPCSKILNLVYGRFFMLDPILAADQVTVPDSLSLSSDHLQESKLFLFENGQEILIKVESQVPSETLQALFGFSQVNIKAPEPTVVVSEHPMNVKLQKLLNELRMRAGAYMSLRLALRSTPLESRFLGHLVDDHSSNGHSYVEFLCSVHRSIQNRLA